MRASGIAGSLVISLALLAGCGGNGGEGTGSPADGTAPRADTTIANLSPCPDELVVHTSGPPTAKVGFLYQLFGSTPVIDPDEQAVSTDIDPYHGTLAGTRLTVRHGDSIVGYQRPLTTLLDDAGIDLALVDTDELIAMSHVNPDPTSMAVSVFAPYEVADTIVFWDDDAHPGVSTIGDLKKWDIRVMYADGAYFMDYLISSGLLFPTQAVGTLDDTPIPFIGSGGRLVKQGSSTTDPYAYRHIHRDWMKEIEHLYIHDTGWQPYPSTLTARTADLASLGPCLDALVPVLQRAQLEFLDDPRDTLTRLMIAARAFDDTIEHSYSQAIAAVDTMVGDALVSRSPTRPIGHQDPARMEQLIDLFARHVAPRRGLAPVSVTSDWIATNRFLDPNITPDRDAGRTTSTTEIEP